ncbi:hypothetical protein KBB96_20620 [Luteolibacter ambystomatis]|uniref:Uncharacterized protein n=1 Tax=Luteolibacter ambystomatis TaxID=2824561 RepID=A0A975G9L2_9BACT|nr:hypothetical protein [Luteolibacter ambystomatis]QUE51245.1 hypothetical protein KBB96_20620 [Luteolibacter ambystomatis]
MSARHLILPAAVLISSVRSLSAEEVGVPMEPTAAITSPIADGTPPPPAPRPETPDFVVKDSVSRQVDVVEASPLPGLPPVAGRISVTTRKVENPGLPDLPPPLPPVDMNDPAVQARLAEIRERFQGQDQPVIAIVAATWYVQEKVSRINWWVDGEQMSCVSRLNMLHFGGFGEFKVGERRYALVMGLGSEDTGRLEQLARAKGVEFVPPDLPVIPDGQDFAVTKGDAADAQKVQLIRDLHALSAVEGIRMEEAYLAREQANKEKEAYLRAHPPKPKDVMIHYWRGQRPETKAVEGGGQ